MVFPQSPHMVRHSHSSSLMVSQELIADTDALASDQMPLKQALSFVAVEKTVMVSPMA